MTRSGGTQSHLCVLRLLWASDNVRSRQTGPSGRASDEAGTLSASAEEHFGLDEGFRKQAFTRPLCRVLTPFSHFSNLTRGIECGFSLIGDKTVFTFLSQWLVLIRKRVAFWKPEVCVPRPWLPCRVVLEECQHSVLIRDRSFEPAVLFEILGPINSDRPSSLTQQ